MFACWVDRDNLLAFFKLPREKIDYNLVLEALFQTIEEDVVFIKEKLEKMVDELSANSSWQLLKEIIVLDYHMVWFPVGVESILYPFDHVRLEFSMHVRTIYFHESLVKLL